MIKRRNKKSNRGQTALIMILLAAAALIFLSITLNWGHIAQTKSLLTVAADQSASLLASDVASYGEMEKQSNLKDTNEISELSGIIMDVILVVVIIIIIIIEIVSWGSATPLVTTFAGAMLTVALAMAIVNLALQLAVVQPGMCALWNKLQKSQPIQQQFYEGGIGAALSGSTTDQVNIADYFDENTNGLFGTTGNIPKDSINRFAFFYTERLKMLNKGEIPQVAFFYNQLMEFMNDETCYQNFEDNSGHPGIPINPSCLDPSTGLNYCGSTPSSPSSDPACLAQIPNLVTCTQNVFEHGSDPTSIPLNSACAVCNSNPLDPSCQLQVSNQFNFQLNDSCTDSDPSSPAYNPYCDSCCQTLVVLVAPATGSTAAKYKSVRPTSCYPYTSSYPSSCYGNPTGTGCTLTNTCATNPNDPSCVLPGGECTINNPYNTYGSYPYIYDPTYQEYANGISFLDQFGRDQQMIPPPPPAVTLPLKSMTVQGNFPNGIYPFFWLMTDLDYSPEVDNINPTTASIKTSQDHWCVAGSTMVGGIVPSVTPPTGFLGLTQLGQASFNLPYACQGADCCVNYLPNSISNNALASSSPITITVGSGPSVALTAPTSGRVFNVGENLTIAGTASELAPGSIASISISITGAGLAGPVNSNNFTLTPAPPNSMTINGSIAIPVSGCINSTVMSGSYTLTATATDANGNTASTGTNDPVTITINNPNVCGSAPCGEDSCGNSCGSCPITQTCSTTTTPGTCSTPPPPSPPPSSPGATQGPSFTIKANVINGLSVVSSPAATITPAGGPSVTMTVTDNGSSLSNGANIPAGDTLVLTATVTGGTATTQVLFYNGTILTGSGVENGNTPTYSYTMSNVPAGAYSLTAAVIDSGSAGSGAANGEIDMVGAGAVTFPLNAPNPVVNTIFGEAATGGSPATPWLAADNQMCSISPPVPPYNGSSTNFPDGSCELTGTIITAANKPGSAPGVNPGISTVDGLDDTMHTFSDFVKFSRSLLNKDLGTVNSTFDTWYSQAAGWIAPACPVSLCNDSSFDLTADQFDQQCNNGTSSSCNQGGDGRLLSIYDPVGYPNVAGVVSNTTNVDKLSDWNTAITNWLNNGYTPSGATSSTVWCVPTEVALGAGTSEDTYIKANASTSTWGDLPHVIACLNYNSGPTQTSSMPNSSNYQTCLNDLAGTCPTTLPDDCATSKLGVITEPVWDPTDTHRCQSFYIDTTKTPPVPSYANWVSNNINFGPAYNYQTCLNLLTNICPASLSKTVCDPLVLGRPLSTPFSGTPYAGGVTHGVPSSSCNPTTAGSYAQWVQSNVSLFVDETPKFALRSAFLTDVYTRAQTLQSITAQADNALHSFLKPCGTAAKCADGGPAAQLIYARSQSDPSRALPNSVIYGWADKTLANGQVLPGGTGYEHIVKVTAYSPGRDGNGAVNLAGLQPILPWIHSWTTFFLQKYALANRDGNVYVSIKRWDQNSSNSCRDGSMCTSGRCSDGSGCGILFPNGHPLWQFMTNNPSAPNLVSGQNDPLAACVSNYSSVGIPVSSPLGFGLELQTVQGLELTNISQRDQVSLAHAFMLNDVGDGKGSVDSNAASSADAIGYNTCLTVANTLLNTGTESHACARYVAALNGSDPSGNGDGDYSIKFVDCNSVDGGSPPQSNP